MRAKVVTVNEHQEESPVGDLETGSVASSGVTRNHKHTSLNRDWVMRLLHGKPQYQKINFQEQG